MEQSGLNTNQYQYLPNQTNPNAVSINIISPQAYGGATNPMQQNPNGFYSMYGQNTQPNLPLYPANYNNMINVPTMPNNTAGMTPNAPQGYMQNEQPQNTNAQTQQPKEAQENKETENKKENDKTKSITPLTDDYVKNLENYLNDPNAKVRLIGAKELMERFKEDENRKDNPSLIPLLNKILLDPSPSVRFLGLVALQSDYCAGDDQTVEILKQIQSVNSDKAGEDQLLAREILLKMSAGNKVEIPDNSPDKPEKPKEDKETGDNEQ